MRILKKRAQFIRANKAQRISKTSFTLKMVKTNSVSNLPAFMISENETKAGIGYTITKKTGNSPQRNRIKRRFRAASNICAHLFKPNYDYVLIGRPKALTTPFSELVKDLKNAVRKINKTI